MDTELSDALVLLALAIVAVIGDWRVRRTEKHLRSEVWRSRYEDRRDPPGDRPTDADGGAGGA